MGPLKREICSIGIDLDGVVWRGKDLIRGADLAIKRLQKKYDVVFVTNNSAKNKLQIQKKLSNLGIPCEESDIFTSGYEAIKRCGTLGYSKIFCIAPEEIKDEYLKRGIQLVSSKSEDYVEAVVVHYYSEFGYRDIATALDFIDLGAKLIACNRERVFPADGGRLLPGCGPLVAAIEYASRKQSLICGKPESEFLLSILQEKDFHKDTFLMVGDSFESDILMAQNCGIQSAFIRSESSEHTYLENITPDWAADSLLELSDLI